MNREDGILENIIFCFSGTGKQSCSSAGNCKKDWEYKNSFDSRHDEKRTYRPAI